MQVTQTETNVIYRQIQWLGKKKGEETKVGGAYCFLTSPAL